LHKPVKAGKKWSTLLRHILLFILTTGTRLHDQIEYYNKKKTNWLKFSMLEAIRRIAERKISEAIRKGLLETKSWRNRPLPMTSDNMVPEELRMAYKILKNAGYLPPEIETKKEIQTIEDLLATCEDECTRVKQMKKLNYLVLKLNIMKGNAVSIESQEEYYRKIVERLSAGKLNAE
jgi:hypothetical protein